MKRDTRSRDIEKRRSGIVQNAVLWAKIAELDRLTLREIVILTEGTAKDQRKYEYCTAVHSTRRGRGTPWGRRRRRAARQTAPEMF